MEAVAAAWKETAEHYGASERIQFMTATTVVHAIAFWGFCGLYELLGRLPPLRKYAIQPGKRPPPELIRRALIENIIGSLVVLPILSYLMQPFFAARGTVFSAPIPDALTILRHLVVCALVEDTLFYWAHRGLHHRSIYAKIHKQHHMFKANIGLACEFSHPLESAINVVATLGGAFLQGSHPLVVSLWIFIRIWETVDGHSGFAFPFSPFNLFLAVQGGADRHEFHHSHNVGSYGSITKFWDWITGTDKAYNEFKAKQAAAASAAEAAKSK